ncbi:MAG: Fis family transcriptional regulator [Actinomycetia bacterium]|nr:Fis family transcriptional regulator [Actinomycetes bacterium]
MVALDFDPDGWRRTGDLVALAGLLLGADFDDLPPCPACGADQASQTIMDNLNARYDWLIDHLRAGAQQASAAADAMNDTATSYQHEDAAAATRYGQFGGSAPGSVSLAPSAGPQPGTAVPPAGMPEVAPVPDVSGTEGEALAQQLETGAGLGPAAATAARLGVLAGRAQAANAALLSAHTQLVGAGQSQATPGAEAKLSRGIAFTEAVAGHASALAAGYQGAGTLHTATLSQVGPSLTWRALKTGYQESMIKNQLLGGLAQSEVDAWQSALEQQDQQKSAGMTGLQTGGDMISAAPAGLADPGLAPGEAGLGEPAEDGETDTDGQDRLKTPEGEAEGMQDMLGPLMGAAAPLAKAAGGANPLKAVGQAVQQLGQQVGQLGNAARKAGSPLKPAALAKPSAGASKGGGGAKLGGGGSPLKPASSLGGAAIGGAPSATPSASGASGSGAPASGTSGTASRGGGMGMMPMGRGGANGGSKSTKVTSYEQPLSEVDEAGRPGVVGQEAKPAEPVVDSQSRNAVKARLERRKKDAASSGDD